MKHLNFEFGEGAEGENKKMIKWHLENEISVIESDLNADNKRSLEADCKKTGDACISE